MHMLNNLIRKTSKNAVNRKNSYTFLLNFVNLLSVLKKCLRNDYQFNIITNVLSHCSLFMALIEKIFQ